MATHKERLVFGLSLNVVALGLVSLFTDISTEMILGILPLFLVYDLGASAAILGVIEGIAESTASLLKMASGWLSDRYGKRKPWITLGYSFSTFIKPALAISTNWLQVLGLRFLDRAGKGVRTSPRDALIADSTPSEAIGRGFGLHRALDTTGAFVGPLLTSILLPIYLYRGVFAWSFLPGLIGVLLLVFLVRDRPQMASKGLKLIVGIRGLPRRFRRYLVAVLLFGLGNFSFSFFILAGNFLLSPKFGEVGASQYVVLLYAMMNAVYALASLPIGILSDKIGKRGILSVGYATFGLTCIGFALVSGDLLAVAVLFIAAGLFMAMVDTMERAYAADLIPPELRGTGYGALHTVNGVADLPASITAGILWSFFSPLTAFAYGAMLSISAAIVLLMTT